MSNLKDIVSELENLRWLLGAKEDEDTCMAAQRLLAQLELLRVKTNPAPKANQHPALWPGLISRLRTDKGVPKTLLDDMQKRHETGVARYGVPLQPHNGRDALQDAYEESLDMAVYLEQCAVEGINVADERASNLRTLISLHKKLQAREALRRG